MMTYQSVSFYTTRKKYDRQESNSGGINNFVSCFGIGNIEGPGSNMIRNWRGDESG